MSGVYAEARPAGDPLHVPSSSYLDRARWSPSRWSRRPRSMRSPSKPPVPIRVRGTIESVDGDVLTVKSRSGEDVKLHMTGDMKVFGIVKISMADIKAGSFIGATTVPGPDGKQNAVEVHVFPENMRGTGEGSRPYDLRPNSTMTNATVAQSVDGNDGHSLTGQIQGRREEGRGLARYAGRDLRARRQVRPEGRRQGDRLHQATAGRFVRNRPDQRRPRRPDAADVTIGVVSYVSGCGRRSTSRFRHPGIRPRPRGIPLRLLPRTLKGTIMPKVSSLLPRALAARLPSSLFVEARHRRSSAGDGPHSRRHRSRRWSDAGGQIPRGHRR